jgi:carbamoyltransferase
MNILGIYGAFGWNPEENPNEWVHDAGATLFCNGNHIASIHEERLTKIKYDGQFPQKSIDYCLNAGNILPSDIDIVCFPSSSSKIFYDNYESNFIKLNLSKIFTKAKFEIVSHHICHAAASVFSSPFNEGSFVSLDGSGSIFKNPWGDIVGFEQSSIGYFNKNKKIFRFFPSIPQYNNFGFYYFTWAHHIYCEKINKNIPIEDPKYRETYSGKVMGLSAYGEFKNHFKDYILSYEGVPSVQFISFPNHTNNPYLSKIRELSPEDKSFFIQKNFENALVDYIKKLKEESYLEDNLCLSGGVFLNILANSKIVKENIVKNIHIPPFTSDCGLAFGSACYTLYRNSQQINLPKNLALLSKLYSNEEIKNCLDNFKNIKYKYYDSFNDLCKVTSKYLYENKIIGWFQNKSELGPRALGSRSLLMNPKFKDNKKILNSRVKHREYWRPFAGIMLENYVSEYFQEGFLNPYMLYSQTVKKEKIKELEAITHQDNTCRIQTVNKDLHLEMSTLLTEYNKISGTPILLNTSFNDNNQPIVETPNDAVKSFLSMDIDVLVIGNYFVEKTNDRR